METEMKEMNDKLGKNGFLDDDSFWWSDPNPN